MKRFRFAQIVLGVPAVLLLASIPAAVIAESYQFTPIDVQGATWTGPFGISSAGDLAGYFADGADGRPRAFIWRAGASAPAQFIEPPDAKITYGIGINRSGEVVGWYQDQANRWHGFHYAAGKYATIDYPDPKSFASLADGINDAGDIVGQYNSLGDPQQPFGRGMRGFLLSKGVFTSIEIPGAITTQSRGINSAGDVVGYFMDANQRVHGFLLKRGATQPLVIDYPGAFQTELTGINDHGAVAGRYKRTSDSSRSDWHGFVRDPGGNFTPVDVEFPGVIVRYTRVRGINNAGEISGDYFDNARNTTRGFRARPMAPPAGRQVMFVDDDGKQCPGAIPSIEDAVAQAAAGATILVCPGTYRGTVAVSGHAKDALRLIGIGREDEVVLQGEHTSRDAVLLINVNDVLVRGFTIRNAGSTPTTSTEWGEGNGIRLEDAHYNTIEQIRIVNMDSTGILLLKSGHNIIRNNLAMAADSWLAASGIRLEGAGSRDNYIRQNLLHGNEVAGIAIRSEGPGNILADNTVINSGGYGIDHRETGGSWIEGNRVSYGRGFWNNTPAGRPAALGINIINSAAVAVVDNRASANTGTDFWWDGKGDGWFQANNCVTAVPAGVCER
jgi:parallel beta-helix repeat protein